MPQISAKPTSMMKDALNFHVLFSLNKLLAWSCLLTFLCRSTVIHAEYSDDRFSDRFYTNSALSFLQDFGQYYNLFDSFYGNAAIVPSKSFKKNRKSIEQSGFLVRNYSNFASWNNAQSGKLYDGETTFFDAVPTMSEEMKKYNNRFRFGPNMDDRFLAIGLDGDPWNTTRQADTIYVHFEGVGEVLPTKTNDVFLCLFKYPVKAKSRVLVEEALKEERIRLNVRCALPAEVLTAIRKNTKGISSIQLDLRQRSTSRNEKKKDRILLSDISVFPTHPLDRRSFRFTAQTMVATIQHPMLVEWLVYNILLGIEHFFLFVNRDVTLEDILKSPIRPFLDANIVSFVYFPYYHPLHFNQVQEPAMNTHLHLFASHSEWVGYWDIDEFFVPAATLRNEYFSMLEEGKHKSTSVVPPSLLAFFVDRIQEEESSGIMIDTMEMGCEKNEPGKRYQAHSMHCLLVGQLFVERNVGHGKTLIRPDRVKYMASPHRLFETPVTWTDKDTAGLFRHFNGFRYSHPSMNFTERDDSLRNMTKKMFEVMLNINNF